MFLKIAFGYPEPGGSVLTNHRISEAQTKHQGVTKQLPRARKRAGSPWWHRGGLPVYSILEQWFSQCGPWTSNLSIHRGPVKNVNLIRNSEGEAQCRVL